MRGVPSLLFRAAILGPPTWTSFAMFWLPYCVGVLGIASQVEASPLERRSAPTYHAKPERANAVKEAFQRGWNGYSKYAFGHDSLRPVTNSFDDDR